MPTKQADRLMPTLRRVVLGRQSTARTDGELLTAFVVSSDADAFGELVRRHGPMVLGVCRRLIPDHATADDAFQATFLVLARRAAVVRPRERVGNYLYGVAYRTALKARMVLARRRSREKQVDAMPEPTAPGAPPAWTDLQPVIDEELARLPEKLRVAVVLCDLEGRAQREVAQQLNVPPATLATRLAAARRTLAARLTRRGVTLSGGALAGLMGLHASAAAVPYPLTAGVVRAAEVLAAGGSVNALVSAQAVQLSEGVMQMMLLAKLKAGAIATAVALVLTTGLGVGLAPAAAGARPGEAEPPAGKAAPGEAHEAAPERPREKAAAPESGDAAFLHRLSLAVRGTVPTDVETWFFVSDSDDGKRAKVVEWLTDDDEQRVAIAKKLGVPVERVHVVRTRVSADGKYVTLGIEANDPKGAVKVLDTAFTNATDGKPFVAGAPAKVVVSEVTNKKPVQTVIRLARPVEESKPGADRTGDTFVTGGPLAAFFDSWTDADDANRNTVWVTENKVATAKPTAVKYVVNILGTDAEFLKRVLTDARGSGPTALELKYFTEDKDPRKHEKLIDTLLKEPAVQKKLGDEWKKKMLAAKTVEGHFFNHLQLDDPAKKFELNFTPNLKVVPGKPFVTEAPKPPTPPTPPALGIQVVPVTPQADKLEKLVGELIAAQKSDEALLEAVTLATLSRLPTAAEKKLALAVAGTAPDRKAGWVTVARALAGTEVKKVDTLKLRAIVEPSTPSAPPAPVKPAKP